MAEPTTKMHTPYQYDQGLSARVKRSRRSHTTPDCNTRHVVRKTTKHSALEMMSIDANLGSGHIVKATAQMTPAIGITRKQSTSVLPLFLFIDVPTSRIQPSSQRKREENCRKSTQSCSGRRGIVGVIGITPYAGLIRSSAGRLD